MKSALGLLLVLSCILVLSSCVTSLPDENQEINPSSGAFTSQFEAEDARIDQVFVIGSDQYASSGGYLYQPSSVANTNAASVSARIPFTVNEAGEYVLWVRMFGPSTSEDAAYVGLNDDVVRVYPTRIGVYEWVRAGSWQLDPGAQSIGIGHAEANARIDLVVIADRELTTNDLDTFVEASILPPPQEETPPETPAPPPSDDPDASEPRTREFSLRGDPDFSEDQLSPGGQVWHRRLIAGFTSQNHDYTTKYAQSGNLYNLGRGLHTHIQSLLWAFRATGDLQILDEVDRLAQIMRSSLDDSWCGGVQSPDPHYGYSVPDGFVNWRWLSSGSTTHYCRDVHRLDESKTHGLVATFAYAYEVNRDQVSPGGVDYAERADFWADYLFNHYEKKWQARKPNGRVDDALTRVNGYDSGHAQMSNIKMHYYLYKLSGDEKYLDRAYGMSAQVFAGLRTTPTPNGDAYVWSRRWIAQEGDTAMYLHPATYARYVFADFAELHVENVGDWGNPVHMPRFANTLVQLMMDDGSNSLARDVGGGVARAGIPASSEDEWGRADANRYAISPYTMIIPWDTTGKGAEVAEGFYQRREGSRIENPRYLQVPAAMIFYHEWQARS